MRTIWTGRYGSPIGDLLLAWTERGLVSLDYWDFEDRFLRLLQRRFSKHSRVTAAPMPETSRALERYFAGEIQTVDTLAVELGGSEFENRVWEALRQIAPGKTATYGEMAALLETPKAARAVGRANSMNPVAIVVPCHRVIGANATLTGYAGGLERKRWLLDHECRWAGTTCDSLQMQLVSLASIEIS